jgi:hypothetical protein
MIGSIYPSMIISSNLLRGPERPVRTVGAKTSDSPKATWPAAEAKSKTSDFADKGEKADEPGYGTQEPFPLFGEIDQTGLIDKMSQLVVTQRSYEAALKIFQTEDDITKEALTILA